MIISHLSKTRLHTFISRRMLYFFDPLGSISVLTLSNFECEKFIVSGNNTDYYHVKNMHVTNFNQTDADFILVEVIPAHEIHVLDMLGKLKYKHPLPPKDELVAIESTISKAIFLAVNRDNNALVIQYPRGLKKNRSSIFYEVKEQTMVSLSLTNFQAAIMTNRSNNYSLAIKELSGKVEADVVYHCQNRTGLNGVILVDTRDQQVLKRICDDKKSLCTAKNKPKCNPSVDMDILLPLRLNATSIYSELTIKIILSFSLAMLCLLVMGLFQLLPPMQE